MFEELGGLFGWLLIFAFTGTILNYILKYINKKYVKKINQNPNMKKIMKIMLKIFVSKHKYFGLVTVFFLLIHFIGQFQKYGINITGGLAAIILIVQVFLGIYANIKKRPRKGKWFICHRAIAVMLLIGIGLHLIIPYSLDFVAGKDNTYVAPDSINKTELKTFTLDEIGTYDGQNGNKAYVAYKGYVYDVTDVPDWNGGSHHGQKAGTDITDSLSLSPHGTSVLSDLSIVGKLE